MLTKPGHPQRCDPRNYSSYDIKLAVDLHTPSLEGLAFGFWETPGTDAASFGAAAYRLMLLEVFTLSSVRPHHVDLDVFMSRVVWLSFFLVDAINKSSKSSRNVWLCLHH